MPFGLKNAPAVFQALMEKVLVECKEFSAVYIDDILIFSKSWEEHLCHIEQVLLALKTAGLTAKPQKCEWGRSYLDYLGHRVGCGKVAVPEHRVAAMANFKQPRTRKDMRSFLGSIGYYRRFIPMFARYSSVLTPSTSVKAPGTVRWTPEMLDAFFKLRESLCSFCILTVPCMNDCYELHTDASGLGIGSVLNVVRKDEVLPVAFYSRQLKGSERRYSATEVEALAVVESVKHFQHFLYGASFKVLTDHKPLTSLLTSKSLNRRLQGMAIKMMCCDIVIVYRKGTENCNADGLSRQAWIQEPVEAAVTVDDPDVGDPPMSGLSRGDCGAAHREEKEQRGTRMKA